MIPEVVKAFSKWDRSAVELVLRARFQVFFAHFLLHSLSYKKITKRKEKKRKVKTKKEERNGCGETNQNLQPYTTVLTTRKREVNEHFHVSVRFKKYGNLDFRPA